MRWRWRSSRSRTRCGARAPQPQRLPVIGEMLAAALSSGDADLVAEAHLLRAAALIELGDPAGRGELASYISLAEGLGHARGRWGALTRRATLAQLVGRADEAARARRTGAQLGRRSASRTPWPASARLAGHWSPWACPNRSWSWSPSTRSGRCFRSSRPGRTRPGVTFSPRRGRLGDFSVLDIAEATGTEGLAAAAVVFAVAGTTAQRSWTYERLRPLAGTHVLVAGCASYHAAVDHHLGALAASLGDTSGSRAHFRAAIRLHERLGAAGLGCGCPSRPWPHLSDHRSRRRATSSASSTGCGISGSGGLMPSWSTPRACGISPS